jgi:hypothetical protein
MMDGTPLKSFSAVTIAQLAQLISSLNWRQGLNLCMMPIEKTPTDPGGAFFCLSDSGS